MIAANDWWQVLIQYNQTIFPTQILFYLVGITLVIMFYIKPGRNTDHLILGYFSFCFFWIGLVFFYLMGKDLPVYQVQTFLFVTLTICFLTNLFTGNTKFRLPKEKFKQILTAVAFFLVLAYPLVSLLLGRPLEKYLLPGSFPCPTTALALVFWSTSIPPKRRWLSALTITFLLIWAIPFPLLIQVSKFGVYEDLIMFSAGLYLIIALIFRKHPKRKKELI